jgi:hypothetical protein
MSFHQKIRGSAKLVPAFAGPVAEGQRGPGTPSQMLANEKMKLGGNTPPASPQLSTRTKQMRQETREKIDSALEILAINAGRKDHKSEAEKRIADAKFRIDALHIASTALALLREDGDAQKSAPLTQDERDLLLVAGENIATVLRARFPTPPQPEQKT